MATSVFRCEAWCSSIPAISRKAAIRPSVDLNSGTNFRRAQLGFQGTAWRDWSYNFVYDFGGNGVEGRGYIYTAYIQYDGLAPFGFRIGAYTPSAGIEDQMGSADLIFLERPASVDVARNIAGAPGREAASISCSGRQLSHLAAPTPASALPMAPRLAPLSRTFDSQQALDRPCLLSRDQQTVT